MHRAQMMMVCAPLAWALVTACREQPIQAPLPPLDQQRHALEAWRHGQSQTLAFGDIRVDITALAADEGQWMPQISIAAPDATAAHHVGMVQFMPGGTALTRTELDGDPSRPEFLLTQYSGGAHCCTVVSIAHHQDGGWHWLDAGAWDGGGITSADVDGDGIAEIQVRDDRFLYRFASYAGSSAPSRFFALRQGAVTDISREAAFQSIFAAEEANFRALCQQGANGGCAAMVAAAARLDRLSQAWTFMLSHYDQASDWDLTACAKTAADGGCAQRIVYADFPKALAALLREAGYAPEDWSG